MRPPAGNDSLRKTLLVGSVPARDTAEAVNLALNELGSRLIAIPDGETGSRSQWVSRIINDLRNNPAVLLKHDGGWSDYRDAPRYAVRRGATIDQGSLDLGYHNAFRESRPVVDALCAEHGIAGASYQVGMASGFDLALIGFGLVGAQRYHGTFNMATVRQIAAIADEVSDRVVFQIELPVEMVSVARTPRALRPAVARWMAGISVQLARMAPIGSRFGVHLCFGDLGNRALVGLGRDCSAAVQLANAIVSRWPATAALDYLHIPLAAGNEPPALHAAYFAPLTRLDLPTNTRLVAGFVHENLSQAQLQDVLGLVEDAAGRIVDVAAPCGLGRRDPQTARDIMHASAILCDTR